MNPDIKYCYKCCKEMDKVDDCTYYCRHCGYSKGVKHDQDKTLWHLLPWDILRTVADVLTFGAKKYVPDNWKHVDNAKVRYFNALQRHLYASEGGEYLDSESGFPHWAHMICCALFYAWHSRKEHVDG